MHSDSLLAVSIRESTYLFTFIEGIHLLAIGVSAGTIVLTGLRLFGLVKKKDPALNV